MHGNVQNEDALASYWGNRVATPDWTSPPLGPSEEALTILVVEDEALIRVALVDYLEDNGFEVVEAGDAASAIQLLLYGDITIDAVFTDICMPGEMDGLGLAAWIRQNRAGLPTIVTSGARRIEAGAEGGLCFFAKPYDCAEVTDRLQEMIAERRQRASAN